MYNPSNTSSKIRTLTGSAFALTFLMAGYATAEKSPETPFPNLDNEIMLQGEVALSQLTREQNVSSNWQQKAATALTSQLTDHEFDQVLAGTTPCEQKKNPASTTVKETTQPNSLINKPGKARS